jgi:hypothetical protein
VALHIGQSPSIRTMSGTSGMVASWLTNLGFKGQNPASR